MLGAIIGDIAGSVYERRPIKTKDFPFWRPDCRFTDDTVMTCAVYSALKKFLDRDMQKGPGARGGWESGPESKQREQGCDERKSGQRDKARGGWESKPSDQPLDEARLESLLIREMKTLGRQYPDCGYGRGFYRWLFSEQSAPYGSYGNGSAMRVSAAGFLADSLEEAKAYASVSARVSHDHPEGIKGAVAVAEGIFLARRGAAPEKIRQALGRYYDLDFTLEEIREDYRFDSSCQGSVPQAIAAFLEAADFEDAIRNAISLGGDSDTLAAMAGSLAEARFGIPETHKKKAFTYLDQRLSKILTE